MTEHRNVFPDFLGIGAQKCGTTWLYFNLSHHPELWLPKWKEIHFFDRLERRRPGWMDALLPRVGRKIRRRLATNIRKDLSKKDWHELRRDLSFYLGKRDLEWYGRIFEPCSGLVCGEITPAYSALDRRTVEDIALLSPDLKILYLIRNPIERTWSSKLKPESKSDHLDIGTMRSFAEKSFIRRRDDYVRTLDIWSSCFESSNIFIGFLEDIRFHREAFLSSIFEFLGVEGDISIPRTGRKNVRSGDTMSLDVARFLAELHLELITELARRLGGPARGWLEIAQWLLNDATGDRVPYPLWDTPAGTAFRSKVPSRLTSRPLSRFDDEGTDQRE
ncbi:MAG: sulfotransferase [Gemmatimonadota bacterium]|nr:sulfotransferase [Gemmatimonadota bacterium]